MNLTDVVINTDRLKLRAIDDTFINAIFDSFTKDITVYMYPQPTGDILDVKSFVKDSKVGLLEGSNLQLVITHKDTGEFLGCCGLHHVNESKPELGIWLKKSAHGNGYGLEAMGSIIGWARLKIKFETLKYPVDRRNDASRRIPEYYGGKIVKEYVYMNMVGNELDIVEYWLK